MSLQICGIFSSIEGETVTAGFTSVFIRLRGCNLNCRFCDTPESKTGGITMTLQEIIAAAEGFYPFHHITLTGGEPLAQTETPQLISELIKKGWNLQIETNGSLPVRDIDRGARIIADVKTPSSGEAKSFLMDNLNYLKKGDELKFIVADENDYLFTKKFIIDNPLAKEVIINLSPSYNELEASVLSSWIIRDRLNARLNLQLHKIAGFR